jgi:predicted  nucleic acid-binding Zn-ribbon protein
MSQQQFYETVQKEQEYLELKLKDYRFQKEKMEWELMQVTNAINEIQGQIVKLEQQLGDVSDS